VAGVDLTMSPEQQKEEAGEDSKWGDDNGEMPSVVEPQAAPKKKKKKSNKSKAVSLI
jgi:hypothetical protein